MDKLTPTEQQQVAMRPIIFSTPMVKAILEGRKTQTRRIMKMSRANDGFYGLSNDPDVSWPADYPFGALMGRNFYDNEAIKCPYGKPGDILYVRETWCWDYKDYPERTEKYYFYKADSPEYYLASGERWYPSIHMPKAAARILLKITDISVERLQDISIDDAVDEGIEYAPEGKRGEYHGYMNYYPVGDDAKTIGFDSSIRSFKSLWRKINGPESWEQNPWVWKVSFERIEKPAKYIQHLETIKNKEDGKEGNIRGTAQ